MKAKLFALLVLATAALFPSSLFAQGFEVRPYVAYYWPGGSGAFDNFQNTQSLGVRGGYYVTSSFEVGGNYSWINHFQPRDSGGPSSFAGDIGFPQGRTRAHIWEGEFSWNVPTMRFGKTLKPYVTGTVGGLTTNVGTPGSFVLNTRLVVLPISGTMIVANDTITGNDTFLTFSYGGGVKAERLWGPLGFFGDIRGRTIPNFFSGSYTWPELSAGVSFAWGER
jgi:hypothetical protein